MPLRNCAFLYTFVIFTLVIFTERLKPPPEAAAPPGMEDFKRSQRNPTDIAKAETDTDTPDPKPNEPNQRGRPEVPGGDQAGVPAPAEAVMVKPAAVVVGSPTPRVGAHPSPAIPVFPNPTAGLVRRPVGPNVGTPDVAVFRNAGPGAVADPYPPRRTLRGRRSGNWWTACMARSRLSDQRSQSSIGPAATTWNSASPAAPRAIKTLAVANPLRTARGKHFDVPVPGRHFGLTAVVDGDAITARPGRTDREARAYRFRYCLR